MLKVNKYWLRISYVLFMIGWTIGDIRNNVGDDFKYALLMISIIMGVFIIAYNLWNNKEETLEKLNCYGMIRILAVVLVFVTVSFCYMIKNGFCSIMARYV